MIVQLKGEVLEKHPDHVVMDLQGIGYHVWITLNTFEILPDDGEATLLIHHQVREDSQELFGFASAEERGIFKHLISVSGIGAKTAIAILSGAPPADLCRRIQTGDEESLTAIPGIGPKIARRVLIELKDKIGGIMATPLRGDNTGEAVCSLMSLGYKSQEAQRAVRAAVKQIGDAPVEEIIRAALSAK